MFTTDDPALAAARTDVDARRRAVVPGRGDTELALAQALSHLAAIVCDQSGFEEVVALTAEAVDCVRRGGQDGAAAGALEIGMALALRGRALEGLGSGREA